MLVGAPLFILFLMVAPRRLAHRFAVGFSHFGLWLLGIRVRSHGLERLDKHKTYVMMCNHVNLLDPFVLYSILPVHSVGIEKRENFKIPFYGWLVGKWGNLPIDRTNLEQAKADMRRAFDLLRSGGSWLFVFPEGTRTRTGTLGPFKKGGFHLALDAGAPIVPVTQRGSWEVLATGSWRLHPGTIDVTFGEPIDPAAYGKERLDSLVADVRRVVEASLSPEPSPASRT